MEGPLLVVPFSPPGDGRGPFIRTSHGRLPASSDQLSGPRPLRRRSRRLRRRRYGRGQREGDHRVTQHWSKLWIAPKGVDDVLDAVDLINGWSRICPARIGHGQGIEDPQDLARRCTRSIEDPVTVAEEHQIASYCHARGGGRGKNGNRPGNLSCQGIDRSVNPVIHAEWRGGAR